MKTKFMVNGSNVSIFKMNEETALDYLPPKVYTLQYDKFVGFYLSITKDLLQIPTKIYGVTNSRVEKCVTSYVNRDKSTGILLTGDKGTGKTLLMSLLANTAITDLKLPVILVKDPYEGEQFTSFIESIGECCLMFDEFGKMYSNNSHDSDQAHQDSLLSLMDGMDKTKRLIIMSENNVFDISEFMLNRPSRIYYHFKYTKLDEASIVGYCIDRDVSSTITKDIVELSRSSRIFSFDMLQSIVEEHLRFNTAVSDVVLDLNVDIRQEMASTIDILKVVEKDSKKACEIVNNKPVTKPISHYAFVQIKSTRATPDGISSVDEEDGYDDISFSNNDLVYEASGNLVYETNRYTITAKELPQMMADYRQLF